MEPTIKAVANRHAEARLLVVEDKLSVRHLIHEVLNESGFTEVDEAGDGSVALEMMREVPYDLVITDWFMPRLGGEGLLLAIRTWPQRVHTPVLVLSGSAEQALEAGADGVVGKPFTSSELVRAVLDFIDADEPFP